MDGSAIYHMLGKKLEKSGMHKIGAQCLINIFYIVKRIRRKVERVGEQRYGNKIFGILHNRR